MRLLRDVLRIYSFVFETVLCAGGMLLCAFTLANHNVTVRVPWLPWEPATQLRWVFGLSVLGLISVWLAAGGFTRVILLLFSGTALVVLLKGLFLNTQYVFAGGSDLRNAIFVVMGAALAFLGSMFGQQRRLS